MNLTVRTDASAIRIQAHCTLCTTNNAMYIIYSCIWCSLQVNLVQHKEATSNIIKSIGKVGCIFIEEQIAFCVIPFLRNVSFMYCGEFISLAANQTQQSDFSHKHFTFSSWKMKWRGQSSFFVEKKSCTIGRKIQSWKLFFVFGQVLSKQKEPLLNSCYLPGWWWCILRRICYELMQIMWCCYG